VANHKSAKKRARQTIVRTARNKTKVSQLRSSLKKLQEAEANKDKSTAMILLKETQSLLAKLAKTGVIKLENAARKTSRLHTSVNKL
jgi:small subunit ribosomal protein S20